MVKTNNSRQAMWIAIGQFASLLIAVISPMIMSRFLPKSDYGTYKQVMYIYTSLLGVFTLGLPKAYSYFIPRVPTSEAKSLINKITRIFFVLGFAFSIFLCAGAGLISSFLKNPDLEIALRCFSVVPLLLLPTLGIEGVYASFQRTYVVAVYTVITKAITLILTIIPVVCLGGTYIHAIIGFDIGSLLTFIVALILKSRPVKHFQASRTRITYNEIFKFSIPLFVASMWGMIINASDQFFISRYFGNEVFAEYSNGFMEFPLITMIIGSISTVLIPLFSGQNKNGSNRDKLLNIWRSTLNKSVKVIYPIAFFCIIFSSIVMICFYGRPYEASGQYFSIKNIQALFCVLPFSPLVLALGKTKEYSVAHMKTAFCVVSLEFIAVKFIPSAISIAWISLLCQFLKVVFQFRIVSKVLNISLFEIINFKSLFKCIIACLLSCIMPIIFNYSIPIEYSWGILACDCILFLVSYYFLCFAMHISYKDIMSSVLNGQKLGVLSKIIP